MNEEAPKERLILGIKRRNFIITFGVVMPIMCAIFDPIVFRDMIGLNPGGAFGSIRLEAYVMMSLGICSLSIWLWKGKNSPIQVGIFYAGGFFSLILGVLMLPLSLFGLILLIGILGFTPFLTGYAFFAAALQAQKELELPRIMCRRTAVIILTFIAVFAIPTLYHVSLNRYVEQKIEVILEENESSDKTVQHLSRMRWLISTERTDAFIFAYTETEDETRQAELVQIYETITGHNFNIALMRHFD